jgi:hypothetical protein
VKLSTIWTLKGMAFRERLRRTADWCDYEIAYHLPKRVKYWAVIHVGSQVTTQARPEVPTDAITLMEVLELAEGQPRT